MNDRDTVKNSIDSIVPEDGAKERMLENIKAKAAAERKSDKKKRLVRYLPLAACFALVIALAALLPEDDGDIALLSDDMGKSAAYHSEEGVEYVDSVGDIKARLGIEPAMPDDALPFSFAVMDDAVSVVGFKWHGQSFELFSAKNAADIPTLSGDEIASDLIGAAMLTAMQDKSDTYLSLTWSDGDAIHRVTSRDCSSGDMKTLYYSLP